MNILIVGGLLVVGIAAILGAVVLGISDQRKEAARANSLKLDNVERPPVPSIPQATPAQNELVPLQSVTAPTATRPNRPSTARTSLTLDRSQEEDVEKLPALNGQFHELANEIRSLHLQVWQLEQRLSTLTEMVNHIERSQHQDDHTGIEEAEEEEQDTHIPSENTIP